MHQVLEELHYPVLPVGIEVATDTNEINEVILFRKSYCDEDREGVQAFHNDGFDAFGYVFFDRDDFGVIQSTSRLLIDSAQGFPAESSMPDSVHQMRAEGLLIAEFGRLVTSSDRSSSLRKHYGASYETAVANHVDTILIVCKTRDVPRHEKLMGVRVLSDDMGKSWDAEQANLSLIAWDVHNTKPSFHRWVKPRAPAFSSELWSDYSRFHLGVLTSIQNEIYTDIASQLHGDVMDIGCGSGRAMAYVMQNKSVTHYTGVDANHEMLREANWLKERLGYEAASLVCSKVEDTDALCHSAFSINSYYTWPDPEFTLRCIRAMIEYNGELHIVTPNDRIDIERLRQLVDREILGHPFYEKFVSINLDIVQQANYKSLDDLISISRLAGFSVTEAHQKFFLGGASYVRLEPNS